MCNLPWLPAVPNNLLHQSLAFIESQRLYLQDLVALRIDGDELKYYRKELIRRKKLPMWDRIQDGIEIREKLFEKFPAMVVNSIQMCLNFVFTDAKTRCPVALKSLKKLTTDTHEFCFIVLLERLLVKFAQTADNKP